MRRESTLLALVAVAVAVLTAGLFWPATRGAFLEWDDSLYLAELQKQPGIAWAFRAVQPFYYHPLTWLSYFLDQRAAGLDPVQFHATNMLLHAVNAGMVVVLAWMILGSTREGLVVAGIVGLVFGLHPLQVEPVAWVAERKTVLCALFSFATVWAYIRGWRWATVGLFGCALLAKPAAMTLPVALVALDFVSPQDRREKWSLLALGAACLVVTVVAQHREEAMMSWAVHGWGERALVAARGFIFYLWKLIWPAWLSPFYPIGGDMTLRSVEFAVPVALVSVITALAVTLRRRVPALLAAWVAYVALVLPVSGLAQAGSQAVADRFAYLAMVPVLLAMAAGVMQLARRFTPVGRTTLVALVTAWVLFLAKQTRAQIPVWHDTETMWRAVLQHYPRSGIAQAQLAAELVRQGRFDEAQPLAESAFAQLPEHPAGRWACEQVRLHRAGEHVARREFAEVLGDAQRVVEIAPSNAVAHATLGLALLKTRAYDKAAIELETALRLKAKLPAARYNLACAYAQLGRIEDARVALAQAVALDAQFAELAVRDPELAALRN